MIATPLNGSSGAGSGGGGSGGGGGGNSGSNNNNTSDGINRVGSGSGGGSNCHDTGTGSLQSASESKLWYSWKHLLLETNKKNTYIQKNPCNFYTFSLDILAKCKECLV